MQKWSPQSDMQAINNSCKSSFCLRRKSGCVPEQQLTFLRSLWNTNPKHKQGFSFPPCLIGIIQCLETRSYRSEVCLRSSEGSFCIEVRGSVFKFWCLPEYQTHKFVLSPFPFGSSVMAAYCSANQAWPSRFARFFFCFFFCHGQMLSNMRQSWDKLDKGVTGAFPIWKICSSI